jgi:hypothetical protein
MQVLCVEEPHMKLARFRPRLMMRRIDTSLFSQPRSPQTRDGIPYFLTAARNMQRTVEGRLFVLAQSPVIYVRWFKIHQQKANKLVRFGNTHPHTRE